jgi:molybdopterin-biosynthesis enzyme MoeA-like protein
MAIGLIIVGDEILSGKRQDKHMTRVIALLSERGLSLDWARYVGDDRARLTADLVDAFDAARTNGDVVFSCGGIGATPDDHTRQCAAAALNRPLAMHPEARSLIVERMRTLAAEKGEAFDPEAPENVHRLNMAMFPEGADIVPNPYNKIAGFSVQVGQGAVYFMPGFPVMAWPMIEWILDERLAHLRQGAAPLSERSVIVFNGLEGLLTPLMQEIETRFVGVKVFSLPSMDHPEWGRHIELGVKGSVAVDLAEAYRHLVAGLQTLGVEMGPELVR